MIDGALLSTAISVLHAMLHENHVAGQDSLRAFRLNVRNAGGCNTLVDLQQKITAAVRDLPSDYQVLDLAIDPSQGGHLVPLESLERRRASRSN